MNATAKKTTYKATFAKSIAGPVLIRVTRSKRAIELDYLPPEVVDYLCVHRASSTSPWVFCMSHDPAQPATWEQFIDLGDEIKPSRPSKTTPPRATVTFSADPPRPSSPVIPKLEQTWHDGAHCGLTDWYETLEGAIVAALAKGKRACWTTDWYASKKEIASARITCSGGEITAEVSVSDDFDTPGLGDRTIPFTEDLEKIRDAIWAAWDEATEDQKANRDYVGFSVGKGDSWAFTIIQPAGDGVYIDHPPGDNYHRWGWQEVEDGEDHPPEIPAAVAQRLLKWTQDGEVGGVEPGGKYTTGGWTVRMWKD